MDAKRQMMDGGNGDKEIENKNRQQKRPAMDWSAGCIAFCID